jgi:hypothetical protein
MTEPDTKKDPRVVTYHTLRKAIGIVGFALPFLLVIGNALFQIVQGEVPGIGDSISGYYYTVMGGVLVGSLCAIGVFLFSYIGYDDPDWLLSPQRIPNLLRGFARVTDNRASNIAGVCAVGVALFPTPRGSDPTTLEEFLGNDILGLLHVGFAAVFFLSLAYISIRLFTKHDPAKGPPPQNRLYRLCGYTILASIVAIFVVWFIPSGHPLKQLDPVFWLETLAILAFSVSWFMKGLKRP